VRPASKLSLYRDASDQWRLIEADALLALKAIPDACIEAVLVDPPYAIAVCGEAWDSFDGGTRAAGQNFERWTQGWAAEALRVLRPGGHMISFGSARTFHRLTSGVETAGFEIRDVLMWLFAQGVPKSQRLPGGLGTTLKPAYEPILLARKPFTGTATSNLRRFGTGVLHIDATRIGDARYWPAHLAFSHATTCTDDACASDCPVALVDQQRPSLNRLFFCAKATKVEREAGCEQLPLQSGHLYTGKRKSPRVRRNVHPTVKPIELMRWLVRLVTPAGGIVLDPFAGSGTTGIAAMLEGRGFVGIEREPRYVDIACARLTHWAATCGAGGGSAVKGPAVPSKHQRKEARKKGGTRC